VLDPEDASVREAFRKSAVSTRFTNDEVADILPQLPF
jgi:hypothetical protein